MNQPPQILRFNLTGQSLTFDCPDGVPTAITSVTVQDDTQADTGTVESATTGSAAIESVTDTLAAAAGTGANNLIIIPVADSTGFAVKRRYWLTGATGWRECVELVGIDTATDYLYTRTQLQNEYVTGDTIASPRCTITIDPTWIADTSKLSGARYSKAFTWLTGAQRDWLAQLDPNPRWRSEWIVTVGGVSKRYATFFDVVRYPLEHGVTMQDADRYSRGLISRLPVEDQGEGDALIAEGLQQVRLDLHALDLAAYAVSGREVLHELVKRKVVHIVARWHRQHGSDIGDLVKEASDDYQELIDKLLGAKARVTAQATADGSAALAENAPIFVR